MNESVEERLRNLVAAHSPSNRYKWALDWKAQVGNVVGVLCSYVPHELIYAQGLLPWRISGSWAEATPLALYHRAPWQDPKNTRILESVLRGELDFLDGVIASDWDVDVKRLWDVWVGVRKPRVAQIIFVPRLVSELHYQKMRKGFANIMSGLEDFLGKKISSDALRHSIQVYNQTRKLIMKLYELRKKDIPPVSGTEALGITLAALVMPPEQFNAELSALLPFLEEHRAPVKTYSPRLLVSSDSLDDIRYLQLVESTGCIVAMDDLDTGSRQFWLTVDESADDPLLSLAKRYLDRPQCPRMADYDTQESQLLQWVREFRIDGVLELKLNYSITRALRSPLLGRALEQAGVPFLSISRDYQLASEGQLRTRIGAFVEMLQGHSSLGE